MDESPFPNLRVETLEGSDFHWWISVCSRISGMESEIQGWNQKDFDPEIQGWKASVPEFRVWISRGSRISGMDEPPVQNFRDE